MLFTTPRCRSRSFPG